MKTTQQYGLQWPDDKGPQVNGFTFWEALVVAFPKKKGTGVDPAPLADYIEAKPLSRSQRAALAKMLRERLPAQWPRGMRGETKAKLPLYEAERQEALRVKAEKRAWLAQHPTTSKGTARREVPYEVTKQMIGPNFDFDRINRLLRDKRRLGSK
jgi:hypothetical protein